MRARLLRGRVRTSTVLLALVFLLTLATYLLVRPVPASVAATANPLATPRPTARPQAGSVAFAWSGQSSARSRVQLMLQERAR